MLYLHQERIPFLEASCKPQKAFTKIVLDTMNSILSVCISLPRYTSKIKLC